MSLKVKSPSILFMLNAFKNSITRHHNSFAGKQIYLASSGGKDSMALTHLLLNLKIPFTLLHCNFKLRIPDCDMDENFLRAFAQQNNIEFNSIQFDTALEAKTQQLSIQETARKLRYDWFKKFIQPDNAILLTAHHLDDNIETLFINLLRGTSVRGLAGIPEDANKIVRPLLLFSQTEITSYVKKEGIEFRQDQSNFENKYLRNNLRNNFLPQLKDISPNFGRKIQQTINSLKEANNFLEKNALLFITEHFETESHQIKISRDQMKTLDPILFEYVFTDYGIHRANRPEFLKFILSKTGAQFHSNSHSFLSNRNDILITTRKESIVSTNYPEISINSIPYGYKNNHIELTINESKNYPTQYMSNSHYFDSKFVKLPLLLRKWKRGDKIIPFGMKGSKLISDILIDKKISNFDKRNVIVICDADDKIISVIGHTSANFTRLTSATTKIIEISWIY